MIEISALVPACSVSKVEMLDTDPQQFLEMLIERIDGADKESNGGGGGSVRGRIVFDEDIPVTNGIF